ncbi:MAG TPA: YraN family protein [Fulvivirga sp.]|nr:YraN family protein [Fulvivirga sp.]
MHSKAEIGLEGEQQAVKYLMSKGYEIVKTNYRHRRSEIDIIANHNELLVFIEVKTKSYSAFGEPEVAVDEKKANKVMEGAEQFIVENNWHGDIRFDVVSIIKNQGRYEIKHFEDAFH